METILFSSLSTLASGFFVGFIFGFLLRKAKVTQFDVIVKQFLFQDFTVVQVILTAIAVGSFGIYGIIGIWPAYALLISKATFLSAALGGGIFGIGMAVMGYCPGTGIGALANGAQDMWFGIAGMITGAALYAHLFDWIAHNIKPTADMTTITLPELFNISPWICIASIWFMVMLLRKWKP